jgi:hypothetical protein
MARRDIANADLKRAQLPSPRAPWEDVQHFALTFDGYKRIGKGLAALANGHLEAGTVPDDLNELRGCLFFEQRRWHAQDEAPDQATMRHVWALVEGIRRELARLPPEW